MDETKPSLDSIDITDDVMTVRINLKRTQAEIIGLGLLEKAKQSLSAFLFQKQMQEKASNGLSIPASKNFIGKLFRR